MTTKRNVLLVSVFTTILSISCISEPKNTSKVNVTTTDTTSVSVVGGKEIAAPKENLRTKFHGSYMVETRGIPSSSPVEVYNLHENGKSQWLFVEVNNKGEAIIKQTKEGTWTATDNSVSIKIKGNTGDLIENYEIKNKVLTNVENSGRYLKLTK